MFAYILEKKEVLSAPVKKSPDTEWYVYLAECSDKTLYCGITSNIITRFQQHNGLIRGGAKYTAGRRPVLLIFFQKFPNKSLALKTEYTIKRLPKHKKRIYLEQLYGTKT